MGLIAVALLLAGTALLVSTIDSTFDGTLIMLVAAVAAAMLVDNRARSPGTPVIAAWVMAPAIVASGVLGPSIGSPVGSVFMAILIAVVTPSRPVALFACVILSSAEIIARLI